MDSVKDYLTPKTFGILAYVCSIVHFLCGVVITGIAVDLNKGEADNFNCNLGPESTIAYKTQVDKSCYSRYQQEYNSPLPFHGFVMLSIWFPIIVGVIYSLCVRRRVEEIDSNNEPQTQENTQVENRGTLYVFKFYFFHLAIRVLSGILFSILQYVLIFPGGFDFEFSCSLPPTRFTTKIAKNASASQPNSTSFTCENSSTSGKQSCWVVVSVLNMGFALIIFMEMTRLRRIPSCDTEFITDYLLRNRYRHRYRTECVYVSAGVALQRTDDERKVSESPGASDSVGPQRTDDERQVVQPFHASDGVDRLELTNMHESRASDGVDLEPINLQECIDFYKGQVLESSRTTDVICGPKTGLDDLYINLVIHTERAMHNFSKNMERHEIFDVYMEVPPNSIRLEEVKDLFYRNQDTRGPCNPRKILAVGRPGIGKTVLTEKIMRDWAKGVDEVYRGKIAFYFKFRWFNAKDPIGMTLKMFLRYGTELSNEKFQRIYEYITTHPKSAFLIFDGLDEFNGNAECLDLLPPPNDPNICMSGISLFVKLISGRLLPGATVLVTSRPTANEFYSRFRFDRTVEIIGFTSDKIEEYVSKFCETHARSDLKSKVWNHIKSSSDLSNLCYIPVNCFIVCTILFQCLSGPRKDTGALPTTLTELYQAAITHFDKHHYRKLHGQSSEEAIKKLQLLAYNGIEPRQLIFDNELFDEGMKNSGLLNSLSNPYSQTQTQFCFIHLTIQEFLAAKHVTETFTQKEIKKFITSHIGNGKWHLVLQFIAGLLGKKNGYKGCVLAFAQSFIVKDDTLDVRDNPLTLLVLKCLREADDEDIAKEACETTAMNHAVSLTRTFSKVTMTCTHVGSLEILKGDMDIITSSDLVAVTFVCKHMKKLTRINFSLYLMVKECYLEVCKFLQQRCIKQLKLSSFNQKDVAKDLFKALMKSKCELKHEHSKLTELDIDAIDVTEESLSTMCEFFENGHASCLEKLSLRSCNITSRGVSILCEVLDNTLCPELTYLELSANTILDEGVTVLCNGLKQNLFNLTQLFLDHCSLTKECIPSLCELLEDKRCNLTVLSLLANQGITDEGLRTLCESALTSEHCKLTVLYLDDCSLTDECISGLCRALEDKHCKLTDLSLAANIGIGDDGLGELCKNALTKEHCKLAKLHLFSCSLTDECIPELRQALQDEHCVLKQLCLKGNNFTQKGRDSLRELMETHKNCKGRDIFFQLHSWT